MSTRYLDSVTFPVKEVPAIMGKGFDYKDDTGHKFIVREDTGAVLSCMTTDYKLVRNEEVLKAVDPIMAENKAVLKEASTFGGGARTKISYRLPNISVDIGRGDLVNPEIIIRNSYDGSMEASAMAGAFRLVCTNGMIIGFILDKGGYRHTHGSGLSEKVFAELVYNLIKDTRSVFTSEFPLLVDTKVKQSDIKKLIKMFPYTALESLTQKMISKPPKNYWDLLNAATWTTTHAMKREVEATHNLEEKIYPAIKKWAGIKAQA
tara:strand:- start:730 stop:1518 length:789 start_codon:yes stop_codon:yes gene_type:complete